ncbi:hypothetical protein VHUM_01201 [Vanrija humicola]|uniref:ABC transporter domain-containing protein n=1 Tax=Vanrija humicola TaxID=5417 RepID=A0A7D8V101_VANHU|nr:hypothetical protein VHUM_01201 [Vanrija humicola]
MTTAITLDAIVAAAPPDVREILDEDEDTRAYLSTALQGKTGEDAKRAVAPFLGLGQKELDALFARLAVGDVKPSAGSTPADTPADTPKRGASPTKKGRKAKEPKALAGPVIQAYSQQSRFHNETLSTLSKDVDLKGVNVSIGDRELLEDSRLWFKAGTHYGLVGRNGAGKSTLLNVIGDKSLVGFPENIRTLYVQQLDVLDTDQSVLDAVLAADGDRLKRLRDVTAIEEATTSGDSGALHAALQAYIERIAHEKIFLAQKTATLRSGARGKKARGVALKAEQSMVKEVHDELYGAGSPDADVAAKVLEKLYSELDATDAHSAEARARSILGGLDVTEAMQDGPVSALSGGWRMRVAIAKAMFVQPDVLLLDECTNHLDLAAIAWLQEYLKSLEDITIVCVSHDRDFLNAISEEIIRLKERKLTYHPGNYDEYEQTEDELRKKRERQHEALERRREHVKKSIEGFVKHAQRTQDSKVLSQVASRNKKLERMAGIDKTEDGKRFKVSYWAGFHSTLRPEIELLQVEKEVDFKIPNPEPLRVSGPLISLAGVSFSYPGKKRRVLKNISLSIMPSDHIALLGLNGCGKSTLVQLLEGGLAPTHGHVERQPRLRIGHYTQHFVDELSGVAEAALSLLMTRAVAFHAEFGLDPPKEGDLRRWLGSFQVSGDLATRPVHTLSGGQRARLAMALMLYDQPHMLLLDEITNHLDMYTVQGLVTALTEYEGTVVLVTHDRHFVREVADDVYVLDGGRLTRLEGGVDEYVAQFE